MKCKKNNLGFTLIELLITVAIMLSILIISITSITGVDKRKKEEAYRQVKNTIETAAEQYINSNEYLFKGTNNSKIPLKYLINNGFLNKIVDPRNGEAINECAYVKIESSGKTFKVGEFKNEVSSDCSLDTVRGNGGKPPELSQKFLCNGNEVSAENGWFNRQKLKNCISNNNPNLGLKFTINKKTDIEVSLSYGETEVGSCGIGEEICNITVNNAFTQNTSISGEEKKYVMKYTNGELERYILAKIDVIVPSVELTRDSSEKDFTYELKDNNSGIGWWVATDTNTAPSQWGKKLGNKIFTLTGSINGNINYNANERSKYLYVKDVAGNINSASKAQYKTCDNAKTVTSPNAYYWEFKQHDCDNKNGPRNVYYFAEWDCNCDIDELSQDICKYNGSTKHSLDSHGSPSSNKTGLSEITIKYRNNSNGKSACKSDDRQFEYVVQVCGDIKLPQEVIKDGKTEIKYSRGDHGYQWYYNGSKEPYNKFKANGWYHSGAYYNRDVINQKWKSKVSDNNSNRDNACKAACKAKAGYYKRVPAE